MPALAPMRQVPGEVIRVCAAQKGAQHKIHLAVDVHGIPVRIIIIEGTCADIRQAYSLVEGLSPKVIIIADKAYSAHSFRSFISEKI